MSTIPLQIPEILKYGIIGLGALLGILTYFLLSKEQGNKIVRPSMLTAIYVFMGFSIILIIFGLLAPNKDNAIQQSSQDPTTLAINRLSQVKAKDNFFL